MKKIVGVLIAVMIATSIFGQSKSESFKVYGNCEMCKNRIEKAVKSEGVSKADWNVDSKIMTVTFNPNKTNTDSIQKVVAAAGHDTDKYAADNNVYEMLPGCCRYKRNASN